MAEWQPIETAPKDGTEVIVGFDVASVWIVHVAFWRHGDERDGDFAPNPADRGWWSYTRGSVTQELLDGYRTPTHWIPLPKVPE